MSQLDQVTQHNAAMVQKSGLAIRQMERDTSNLIQLTGKFQLLDETETTEHMKHEASDMNYALSA
ncbi:MAG: hypothetical protein ACKVKF_20470 [Rhodobacterales bacterium]